MSNTMPSRKTSSYRIKMLKLQDLQDAYDDVLAHEEVDDDNQSNAEQREPTSSTENQRSEYRNYYSTPYPLSRLLQRGRLVDTNNCNNSSSTTSNKKREEGIMDFLLNRMLCQCNDQTNYTTVDEPNEVAYYDDDRVKAAHRQFFASTPIHFTKYRDTSTATTTTISTVPISNKTTSNSSSISSKAIASPFRPRPGGFMEGMDDLRVTHSPASSSMAMFGSSIDMMSPMHHLLDDDDDDDNECCCDDGTSINNDPHKIKSCETATTANSSHVHSIDNDDDDNVFNHNGLNSKNCTTKQSMVQVLSPGYCVWSSEDQQTYKVSKNNNTKQRDDATDMTVFSQENSILSGSSIFSRGNSLIDFPVDDDDDDDEIREGNNNLIQPSTPIFDDDDDDDDDVVDFENHKNNNNNMIIIPDVSPTTTKSKHWGYEKEVGHARIQTTGDVVSENGNPNVVPIYAGRAA